MVRHTIWPPPPQGPSLRAAGPRQKRSPAVKGASFQDVLKKTSETLDVKFSGHAAERLRSRKIGVTRQQRDQLRGAIDTAATKGARESLVLMDDLALVVSVPNRTVITVARQSDLAEKVFTGIDSAVVLAGTNTG